MKFYALEKLHFEGMFQQTLERREEMKHGEETLQKGEFLECLRKKMAASVNGPGDWGQSDHRMPESGGGVGGFVGTSAPSLSE